jgi:hypothetical protein
MKARRMATKRLTLSDILSVIDLLCESLLGFSCDDGSCGGLRVWFIRRLCSRPMDQEYYTLSNFETKISFCSTGTMLLDIVGTVCVRL